MDRTTQYLIGALFLLTAGSFFWLCFMLWKPDKWGAFVDWEYDFLVRKGVVSSSLADKGRRVEKGFVLKLLVGATVAVGTVFLVAAGLLLGSS